MICALGRSVVLDQNHSRHAMLILGAMRKRVGKYFGVLDSGRASLDGDGRRG